MSRFRPHRRFVAGLLAFACLAPGAVMAEEVVWRLDNLRRIGGFETKVEGRPRVVRTPVGKAILFDGVDDSVFIGGRPLVGAKTFTLEVLVRPDGGKFEQRFMHVAETDPVTGLDTLPTGTADRNPRFMFEVRVKDGQWALDAFVNSKAGSKPLLFMDKLHPLGRWHVVTQTYDGKTYRAYVDGVLQGEADVAFTPHGPGHVRVGARMNQIDHFTGAIAKARFTDRALQPNEFLRVEK